MSEHPSKGSSIGLADMPHETSAPVLLMAHLQYSVGELSLRLDFTLSARRNVLFGPSGAGKSTVLRLLAGLLRPEAGTITLGERRLTDTASGLAVPPGRRDIGYLTQDPALFPHLTVAGNIAYGLHELSRQSRRSRVSAMLALFALEPLAERRASGLSGGERQRVALARALAPQPSLLLLDEPFAALDAPRRDETAAALTQYLLTRPTTVLAVSHDVAEVYASGTAERVDVLLLDEGKVTAQGPPSQVLASHRERLLLQLAGLSHPDRV